eukprot:Amastigsp_a339332_513.p4 type:complete len:123 gc:universal Amastigsp_a339332_513:1119-1487(+)
MARRVPLLSPGCRKSAILVLVTAPVVGWVVSTEIGSRGRFSTRSRGSANGSTAVYGMRSADSIVGLAALNRSAIARRRLAIQAPSPVVSSTESSTSMLVLNCTSRSRSVRGTPSRMPTKVTP